MVNLRGRLGSRTRITSIAAHTATNAHSVPALASAAISASGNSPAMTATTIAVKIVIRTGDPRFDTRARLGGSSPSRAMVKKIRLCPKKNARITVGKRDDRRNRQEPRRPRLVELAQDQRQRLGTVGEAGVGNRPDRRRRDRHVDDDAQQHRPDDPDGEVAVGVLGFLGRGGDRVEAVESEEDDRRRGHHPDLAPRRARPREAVGHERLEIGGVEERQRDDDEHRQRDHLDHHQRGVEVGALARPRDQQPRDHRDDRDRRQIDDPAKLGPVGQRERHVDSNGAA